MDGADPFSRHPDLRGKIADPLSSPWRRITTATLAAMMDARGMDGGWWYPDHVREAERADVLASRRDTDLWVFGYGSLMWDPAVRFVEVRRAHVPDHARRFILKDVRGARGTVEAPGLMAALDQGPGCHGIAFRIARDDIETETEVLWRRERIGAAYRPVFVEAQTEDGPISALTFVADHAARAIEPNLTRAEQIAYFATGTGFLGSSLDYLRNIADQFATLGIRDDDVVELLRQTEASIAARAASAAAG